MIILFHPRATKPRNCRLPLAVLALGVLGVGTSGPIIAATRAPSLANACACARPMPPAAPVMATTRPSQMPGIARPANSCAR